MGSARLPVDIQDFGYLRKNEYRYVDKTDMVYLLASMGKTYFLARPTRFGKSLLVSTLEAYFSGREDLFQGLAIEELEQQSPTYINEEGKRIPWVKGPVIHLDFNNVDSETLENVRDSISEKLSKYESLWGKEDGDLTIAGRFLSLIENMHAKTGVPVAVLVDEYDKPLLNTFQNEELNQKIRDLLKTFFGTLKTADAHTRFVFITGVTKFSHVSIFSDLNQVRDISLRKEFNTLCGWTREEIVRNFSDELTEFSRDVSMSEEELISELTDRYDGYLFASEGEGIFNPFSVLCALDSHEFEDYWFQTAAPAFLIKTVKETNFDITSMVKGIQAQKKDFMSYKASLEEPIPLFYQSGYLTIKDYDPNLKQFTLRFPNKEVKGSFLEYILPIYLGSAEDDRAFNYRMFAADIKNGNVDGFMQRLKSLLASVPYGTAAASYEHTYQTALYLIFTLCGQDVRTEVHTISGRVDAVMETDHYIYIFEFKTDRNGSAENALDQIDSKGYAEPYLASGKNVVKIGAVFSTDQKNLLEYTVQ